ncbi:hypothetical protein [Martelella limonii]|uniref:hypothetical protein n=1 Tax=Martelella limonii TaxID=1647649 RepID=UPI0015805599|nr:hypothetical protein [Martelella limonii]
MFDTYNENNRYSEMNSSVDSGETQFSELKPQDLQMVSGGKSFWSSAWGIATEVAGATGAGVIGKIIHSAVSSPKSPVPIGLVRTENIGRLPETQPVISVGAPSNVAEVGSRVGLLEDLSEVAEIAEIGSAIL